MGFRKRNKSHAINQFMGDVNFHIVSLSCGLFGCFKLIVGIDFKHVNLNFKAYFKANCIHCNLCYFPSFSAIQQPQNSTSNQSTVLPTSNKTGNKHVFKLNTWSLLTVKPQNTLSMLNTFPFYKYMHLNYLRLANNTRLCKTVEWTGEKE